MSAPIPSPTHGGGGDHGGGREAREHYLSKDTLLQDAAAADTFDEVAPPANFFFSVAAGTLPVGIVQHPVKHGICVLPSGSGLLFVLIFFILGDSSIFSR